MNIEGVKEVKTKKILFLHVKSVLKYIESIIIKKWVKKIKFREPTWGEGGVWPSWSKANFFIFV